MIKITVSRSVTVDGQTITESVYLETEFPDPQQEKVKELTEQVKSQNDRLREATERNQPE